jgi:hypothetical protein
MMIVMANCFPLFEKWIFIIFLDSLIVWKLLLNIEQTDGRLMQMNGTTARSFFADYFQTQFVTFLETIATEIECFSLFNTFVLSIVSSIPLQFNVAKLIFLLLLPCLRARQQKEDVRELEIM